MNRSGIEYLDYSWSPITGCLHGPDTCPIVDDCWARAYANRFRSGYGPGFRPALHVSRLQEPLARKKPARIGVSFMGDMFGPQVYRHWQLQVLEVVRCCPQHTFIFLTKAGEQLPQFNPWPPNAWVGVSLTGALPGRDRLNLHSLWGVRATVRCVSLGPFLGYEELPPPTEWGTVQWLVMGATTGTRAAQPQLRWVQHMMDMAREQGIKVFLKKNLRRALPGLPILEEVPSWAPYYPSI